MAPIRALLALSLVLCIAFADARKTLRDDGRGLAVEGALPPRPPACLPAATCAAALTAARGTQAKQPL